jgi:ribonuclease HI
VSRILVYTDGSSLGNPGPGGWAAIIANEEQVVELGRAEAHTTNNRMELLAAHEGITKAATLGEGPIIIRTDSAYVLQGATKWGAGWRKRGWKTLEGKDVLNRDLWEPFFTLLGGVKGRVTWEKVGGHVSIPGNERADTIATSFAAGAEVALYNGSRAAYDIDLESTVANADETSTRAKDRTHAKAKAYSYVSLVGNEIRIHKTWDSCKEHVEGQKNAKYRKAVSEEDEARILGEFASYIK